MAQERGCGFGADKPRCQDITHATAQRRERRAPVWIQPTSPCAKVSDRVAIDNWAHLSYNVAQ
jgi:hypothetical protein